MPIKTNQKITKKEKAFIFVIGLIFLLDFTLFPHPVRAAELESEEEQAELAFYAIANNFQKALELDKTKANIERIIIQNISQYAPSQADFKEKAPIITINPLSRLPQSKDRPIVAWSDYRVITGYNSLPWQTDDSPCITANNFNVCEHNIEDTIAANFLKFETKVRIPALFGDRIFIVRDRMNRRYPDNVDVWLKNESDAWKLGRKIARIEVLE